MLTVESADGPSFSLVVEDSDGALLKKTYAFRGQHVRLISKEPYERPAPLPEVAPAKAFDVGTRDEPDTWSKKVKTFAVRWFGM